MSDAGAFWADWLGWVADWLFVTSTRFGVLCLAAMGGSWALRTLGVHARAVLWRTVLVMLVVTCLLPAVWPFGSQPGLLTVPAWTGGAVSPWPLAPEPSAVTPAPTADPGLPPPPGTRQARSVYWWHILIVIWAAVAFLKAAHLGLGVLSVRAKIRASVRFDDPRCERELCAARGRISAKHGVEVRTTGWHGAPALCGWRRHIVLLPESAYTWPPVRLRAVLAHELMHSRYRDGWFSWVAAGLCTLFWFHPLVLYAVRQASRFQEMRCDDEVVRSGVAPGSYADTLVDFARARTRTAADHLALSFSSRSDLEERVRAVLSHRGAGGLPQVAGPVVCAVMLAAAACAWAIQVNPAHAPGRARGAATITPHSASERVGLPEAFERVRVNLTGTLRVRATSGAPGIEVHAPSRAHLAGFLGRLEIRTEGTLCTITERRDGESPVDPGPVVIDLYLPRPVALECTVHNGDISCEAPVTSVEAVTSHGSVFFSAPEVTRGPISLRSSRGTVTARLGRLEGTIRAGTSLGDVEIGIQDPASRGHVVAVSARGHLSVRVPSAAEAVHIPTAPFQQGGSPVAFVGPPTDSLLVHTHTSLGTVRVIHQD